MTKQIESEVEIRITVKTFEDGGAEVYMKSRGAEFTQMAYITKYLMWITAKNSEAEFEEALQGLCQGARNFKGVSLSVVPVPGKKD